MYTVKNHRLYLDDKPVRYYPSPHYQNRALNPLYLIVHYTAGTRPSQTINWFINPAAKASAHLLIDRYGVVVQFVPLNLVAWHAGASRYGNLRNLNYYSIGVELDNAGRLSKVGGKWQRLDRTFSDDEVLLTRRLLTTYAWERYPDVQINALVEVVQALRSTYGHMDILGHNEVNSAKLDPGPAFPWDRFR